MHPDTQWMLQMGRQLTATVDGILLGKRYLIPDRDTSEFGCIACCALDVVVLSNYTGASNRQETSHESTRASAENSHASATA
jgi:hypothetical protein